MELPQNLWELVLRLPETTQTSVTETLSDEEWQVVRGAINEAIEHLVDFRKQEGEALYKKFTEKVDNIERHLHEIEPFEKNRVEKIRQRFLQVVKHARVGSLNLVVVDGDRGIEFLRIGAKGYCKAHQQCREPLQSLASYHSPFALVVR